jgi:hypothetical protein
MAEQGSTVEERLRLLGAELEQPPATELAATVRARLEREPLGAAPHPRLKARRSIAAALAILLLSGGVAYAASSEFREAVRDLLGIGAVEIERAPELPSVPPGTNLGLGEPIASAAAAERAGFTPLTSDAPLLRHPGGVFARSLPSGVAVSFTYRPRANLPAIPAAQGVGLLLTQLDSKADPGIVKTLLSDARVEKARVGGARGYWLGDGDHVVALPGDAGAQGPPRASANTLLWERDGITLRLEAEISKARAVRLARTLG